MKKILVLLLFSYTLTTCNKYYDYEIDYAGDKLVVNAVIDAATGIEVSLAKSHNPFGKFTPEDLIAKNGRVWLYENDSLLGELSQNTKKRFFMPNLRPIAGKSYRLKAVAEGLDTVISDNVIVPDAPMIEHHFFTRNDSLAMSTNASASYITVKFKDMAGQKNYYAFTESYIKISVDSIEMDNGGIFGISEACDVQNPFFTDKCFDGQGFEIKYRTEHRNEGTWYIKFAQVDKLYFDNEGTLQQPSGLDLAFMEPHFVKSNMINGYGIFVAQNSKTFSVKL